MAEYIEREKAENVFWEEQQKLLEWKRYHQFDKDEKEEYDRLEDCRDKIKAIPTADVVEVVRCKDCKNAYINSFSAQSGIAICRFWSNRSETNILAVQQDDYCSYGELKEREGK